MTNQNEFSCGFKIEIGLNNNDHIPEKNEKLNKTERLDALYFVTNAKNVDKYKKLYNDTIKFLNIYDFINKINNNE